MTLSQDESLPAFLGRLLRKIRADELLSRASSLAFTTLVSLVPLFAAVAFLYARFLSEGEQRILEALSKLLPYSEAQILAAIREFVAHAAGLSVWGTLGFVAVALLALRSAEAALETIFGVARPRSLVGRWLRLGALLVWGPLALLAVQALELALSRRIPGQPLSVLSVSKLLTLTVGILALGMVYHLIAAGRLRFRHALAGATVAALFLELLRWAFFAYVELFSTATRIVYGSFAIAFFFVIAIELAWVILLGSASLAICLSDRRAGHSPDSDPLPPWQVPELLALLVELARTAPQGSTPEELSTRLGLDSRSFDRWLAPFVRRGWILKPQPGQPRWRLAVSPGELTVHQLVCQLDLATPANTTLQPYGFRVREQLLAELGDASIADLAALTERAGDPA